MIDTARKGRRRRKRSSIDAARDALVAATRWSWGLPRDIGDAEPTPRNHALYNFSETERHRPAQRRSTTIAALSGTPLGANDDETD
jgi:hypothetical protein